MVKQDLISSITNFVINLPHEVPNDISLGILGNYEVLGKILNWIETEFSVQSPFQK